MLTSCSKLPQAEMDAAAAAIDSAKTVGADIYVHELFVALQDSMNIATVNIETQKSKFFKNYTPAKEQLIRVAQFAGEVKQKSEIRKEELKVEIQNTIAEVKALIESDRQLVQQAPRGKEGTSALVAIKAEIDAVETAINESTALYETGDYIATLDKVKAAKEKASAINTELTEVIEKYKGKKK